MSYGASGRKPFEYASKIQHVGIVKDPAVQLLLEKCQLPPPSGECVISDKDLIKVRGDEHSKIKTFVAVDGGYSTVSVRKDFPSSEIAFMQFGALVFSSEDLQGLSKKEFIEPRDIGKLKNIERFKFAVPLKNISLGGLTLVNSVRKSLLDFFLRVSVHGAHPFRFDGAQVFRLHDAHSFRFDSAHLVRPQVAA